MSAREKREILLPEMVQIWLVVVVVVLLVFVGPSLKTAEHWLRIGGPLMVVLLSPLLAFYIMRVVQIRKSLAGSAR